jgi:hypothetical protein
MLWEYSPCFWRFIYLLVPHVFGDVLHVFGDLFIYLYPMFLGMFSMFMEIYLINCTPCFWGCSPCFWRFLYLFVPHVFGGVLHVFGDCLQFKLFGHPGLVICGDSKMSAILALGKFFNYHRFSYGPTMIVFIHKLYIN